MIDFVSVDPSAMMQEAVSRYEQTSGETLYPGDEHYMFLSQMLSLVTVAREAINSAANRNLLQNADGEVLDAYGNQYVIPRLDATAASVRLEFSIPSPVAVGVQIPAKTRVSPDGTLMFATDAAATIPAGQISVQVQATAGVAGTVYNGFLPGQITGMVDPVAGIGSVSNITTSAGGADAESDERYRERIRQSWEGLTTAGSKESYEFWAKSTSALVADAEAVRTAPGEVTLYVLAVDSITPSQGLLDDVMAVCGSPRRRGITDHLIVTGAQQVTFNVACTYYINQARSVDEALIQAAVNIAASDFVAAQKAQMGGHLNPDDLRKALLSAGAYRIDISAPDFLALEDYQVAVAGSVSVTYGGLL